MKQIFLRKILELLSHHNQVKSVVNISMTFCKDYLERVLSSHSWKMISTSQARIT